MRASSHAIQAALLVGWVIAAVSGSGAWNAASANWRDNRASGILGIPLRWFAAPAQPARRATERLALRDKPRRLTAIAAPPPNRPASPTTRVGIVIGDSLSEWLAYGLEQTYADPADLMIARKTRPSFGLADGCDGSSRAWLQQSLSPDNVAFVVVMLGIADRRPIEDCGESAPAPDAQAGATSSATSWTYSFPSKEWATAYSRHIDGAIAVLKAKNVPVFWVGLPPARSIPNSEIEYLNDLYRERAERAGIDFVDVWDGFADEDGDFSMRGPDVDGQMRRLRAGDGLHFTTAGALKLALYVEREIDRVLPRRSARARDESGEAVPAGPPHPASGPVVPLTATDQTPTDQLLGAPSSRQRATSKPPVVGRAESPVRPPRGRADDFSWPRASAVPNGARDEGGR